MALLALAYAAAVVPAAGGGTATAAASGDGQRPGSATTTASPAENLAFADAADISCALGRNCSVGGLPVSRGVCVWTGSGNECWDVCNPKHTPQEYRIIEPITSTSTSQAGEQRKRAQQNSALAGLVSQVRAGLNSFVQCPGPLAVGDRCPPGRPCGRHMLFKFKVPEGRGMCVVDESEPSGRACWDMCDQRHQPEDFTVGTAEGAAQRVWEVRQNGGCPSSPWWPWLLVALISLFLLTCCIWVFVVLFRMGRKRTRGLGTLGRGGPPLEAAPGPELKQEFLEPAAAPAGVEDRGMAPEDYREDYREDYSPQGYTAREEYRIPDPPAPVLEEEGMQELPPEPPLDRLREPPPPPQVIREELPPPVPDPRMELFDRIDVNHDGQITREEYENFFPGGAVHSAATASMRIPGLDEPNLLFPSIQPLVVPQSGAQVAPPDLLSQAVPRNMFLNPGDPLGSSQPQVMTPFRMTTGGSNAPTFQTHHTQLSPAFATRPPLSAVAGPGSVQLRPGALRSPMPSPSPGGQPFFTQLPQR